MDLQEVEVFIEKDGRVRVEVRGVKGMSCLDVTQALEAALGGQVQERQLTPEAHETAQEQEQQQRQWGG
jgi:hypothetical protein